MIVANLTTIIANLALARSINYNHKVRCILKRTYMIVNCNPKPFMVQATGRASTNDPWLKGLNRAIQFQKQALSIQLLMSKIVNLMATISNIKIKVEKYFENLET